MEFPSVSFNWAGAREIFADPDPISSWVRLQIASLNLISKLFPDDRSFQLRVGVRTLLFVCNECTSAFTFAHVLEDFNALPLSPIVVETDITNARESHFREEFPVIILRDPLFFAG